MEPAAPRKRVLAVDDDEELLGVYESFLGFAGYEVIAVNNAEACLRFLKEDVADLILLDVNMPGINGLQLLEFIRSSERIRAMRVIMVSGNHDEETVRKALLLGCDAFVVKPFNPVDLERRIAMELVSITAADIRALVSGELREKRSLLREPGMQEFSVLLWDSYPVTFKSIRLCILVPRGVRPGHFANAPTEELEERLVVLFRHPQKWTEVWPRRTADIKASPGGASAGKGGDPMPVPGRRPGERAH